jgi:hypothetical protein
LIGQMLDVTVTQALPHSLRAVWAESDGAATGIAPIPSLSAI